jgi:hypothetical protein
LSRKTKKIVGKKFTLTIWHFSQSKFYFSFYGKFGTFLKVNFIFPFMEEKISGKKIHQGRKEVVRERESNPTNNQTLLLIVSFHERKRCTREDDVLHNKFS